VEWEEGATGRYLDAFLERVLLVGQIVAQGLQTRALTEHGPFGELLNFRLECVYMRLVLAHQRLEILDVLVLGRVYVT
jgi:hypothetical protein